MIRTQPASMADKFMLRLPEDLREKIVAAATENHRSVNNEIMAVLTACYFRDAGGSRENSIALRDQIATHAICNPRLCDDPTDAERKLLGDGMGLSRLMASRAYRVADAMLEARK
jgi:hypothetical protein